jgi:hypothetical protein
MPLFCDAVSGKSQHSTCSIAHVVRKWDEVSRVLPRRLGILNHCSNRPSTNTVLDLIVRPSMLTAGEFFYIVRHLYFPLVVSVYISL